MKSVAVKMLLIFNLKLTVVLVKHEGKETVSGLKIKSDDYLRGNIIL